MPARRFPNALCDLARHSASIEEPPTLSVLDRSLTVNFAKLPELLRRSPPKASVKGRSRTFHDTEGEASVDYFAGLDVSVKGSSICIVDHRCQ
jgi:hypothetical protein